MTECALDEDPSTTQSPSSSSICPHTTISIPVIVGVVMVVNKNQIVFATSQSNDSRMVVVMVVSVARSGRGPLHLCMRNRSSVSLTNWLTKSTCSSRDALCATNAWLNGCRRRRRRTRTRTRRGTRHEHRR